MLDETSLEPVDDFVTPVDHLRGYKLSDLGNQNVLVVRSVEDNDLPGPGQLTLDAPEEVVTPLVGGGCLERDDPHALWVEAAERIPYRAVLSTRIHSLKHDQHRSLALRVEAFLERHDVLLVGQSSFIDPDALDAVCLRRIDSGEVDAAPTWPGAQKFADRAVIPSLLAVRHVVSEDGSKLVTKAVTAIR